jgi:hypothetical protein
MVKPERNNGRGKRATPIAQILPPMQPTFTSIEQAFEAAPDHKSFSWSHSGHLAPPVFSTANTNTSTFEIAEGTIISLAECIATSTLNTMMPLVRCTATDMNLSIRTSVPHTVLVFYGNDAIPSLSVPFWNGSAFKHGKSPLMMVDSKSLGNSLFQSQIGDIFAKLYADPAIRTLPTKCSVDWPTKENERTDRSRDLRFCIFYSCVPGTQTQTAAGMYTLSGSASAFVPTKDTQSQIVNDVAPHTIAISKPAAASKTKKLMEKKTRTKKSNSPMHVQPIPELTYLETAGKYGNKASEQYKRSKLNEDDRTFYRQPLSAGYY